MFSILMILITTGVFAGGGFENIIMYQPTNVPNNQGAMIELSSTKSMAASNFSSDINTVYSSSFDGNLALFCIADTLNSSVTGNANAVEFVIESDFGEGFYFVKNGNETQKVQFFLDAVLIEFQHRNYYVYHSFSSKQRVKISDEVSVGESKKASFSQTVVEGKSRYTLTMPSTSYDGDYPNYPRYYYVCVNIPGATGLEDGEYTARLYLTCDRLGLDQELILINGYVGEKPVEIFSGDFSFFVSNGNNTLFSDLAVSKGTNSPALDIAQLFFYCSNPLSTNSEPDDEYRQTKYRIYISPTINYQDSGEYVFRKTGTENQSDENNFPNRVFFELDTTTTTGLVKYNNDETNNTYYLFPDYTSVKTKSGQWGGNDTYQETWKLEDKHIYIKVSEDSKELLNPPEGQQAKTHATGTYSSYIYFTVETLDI